MPVPIPLYDRMTMRVLAFRRDDCDLQPASITAVARIDVVTHPALGCGVGRLMAATQGSQGHGARPFIGERLEHAVLKPSPPDILVAADTGTREAVPDAIRRKLPWIVVFVAWRRIQAMVPSIMLEVCWNHGEQGSTPNPAASRLEREAWFISLALHQLLHHASPDELVALSRDA